MDTLDLDTVVIPDKSEGSAFLQRRNPSSCMVDCDPSSSCLKRTTKDLFHCTRQGISRELWALGELFQLVFLPCFPLPPGWGRTDCLFVWRDLKTRSHSACNWHTCINECIIDFPHKGFPKTIIIKWLLKKLEPHVNNYGHNLIILSCSIFNFQGVHPSTRCLIFEWLFINKRGFDFSWQKQCQRSVKRKGGLNSLLLFLTLWRMIGVDISNNKES